MRRGARCGGRMRDFCTGDANRENLQSPARRRIPRANTTACFFQGDPAVRLQLLQLPLPRARRSIRGFTLIELMVVVLVIGILAAIVMPQYIRMMDNAKEGSTKTNMHTVQVAAEDYSVQHDGTYSNIMDATHIANLLPPSYKNPFNGGAGIGVAWEDRPTFAADASPVSGIVSYSD